MSYAVAPWHIIILALMLVVYWTPTIVAMIRRDDLPNFWPVVVINLFFGWTLIGWVVALVMACRSRRKRRAN